MQTENIDPLKLISYLWPHITLYDKQREIVLSVWENDETVVPAGNQLGKDFVGGLIALTFFLSRHPCRIVTTSVDGTQLNAVLWGEIRRFIHSAAVPLTTENGGPLLVNDQRIRKKVAGDICGLSYIIGRVATQEGEGMLGHHIPKTGDGIPRTLFMADEASGVPQVYFDKADRWADRIMIIGNCFPCNNRFKWAVKGRPGSNDRGGNMPRLRGGPGLFRMVIRIRAEDSPNVKLAEAQIARGEEPTYEMLIPGVKDYAKYLKDRELLDAPMQCVSLDADWYEGKEQLLYPPEWLNLSERYASLLESQGTKRRARAIGCDPGEGGANSAWSVVDEMGLIELVSMKTPDTSVIPHITMSLMRKHAVAAEDTVFDAGGGGIQHASLMRANGFQVRTVLFGEAATDADQFRAKSRYRDKQIKVEEHEIKYVYKNRRSEMYGLLHLQLKPVKGPDGKLVSRFGLPREYVELRRQLAPLPLIWGSEGRMEMLPKNRTTANSQTSTITELLGCSPDEADSLVLAVFGMLVKPSTTMAGGLMV